MNGRRASPRKGNVPGPRPPGLVITALESERLDATIRKTRAFSLMSNTKWRELSKILGDVPSIDHYFLKSLRSPTAYPGFGFLSDRVPYAYMDTLSFGPIPLREIEWIEFPAVVAKRASGPTPAGGHKQDLDALLRALAKAGKFPVEITSRGLRVIGHIRNAASS
jgi:hypothetical protein